jgi:molybdopterin/thiamine biosynthesis adenylyltransferase
MKIVKFIKKFLRPIKIRLIMLKAIVVRKINQKIRPNYKCSANTKRCFDNKLSPYCKYEYFGEDTPICCATHLYNILKDVTKVLEKNNLEYFVSFGTLLGAVRHGGLIPWDTDTDIIIPDNKKEEYLKLLQKELGDKYYIKETKEKDVVGSVIRVNLSKVNTLHLDMFTYFEKDNNLVFDKKVTIPKNEIFPLSKVNFYQSKFFAPKETEKHIERIYGKDYMKYAYKQWALDKTKFEITDFLPANIEV